MAAFHKPARQEMTLINRALGRWAAFEGLKDKTFLIMEEKVNGGSSSAKKSAVCVVSKELEPIAMSLQPNYAGLVIGELTRKKQFVPSLAGIELFARNVAKGKAQANSIPNVVVNDGAEQLVLYGRDVMGNSIVEAAENLEENELVIILNIRKEAIGLGITRFSGNLLLQQGKVTVTTLADAGHYLRKEDEDGKP